MLLFRCRFDRRDRELLPRTALLADDARIVVPLLKGKRSIVPQVQELLAEHGLLYKHTGRGASSKNGEWEQPSARSMH
jgi:hypothetical protein